jgi:hypothetical protein
MESTSLSENTRKMLSGSNAKDLNLMLTDLEWDALGAEHGFQRSLGRWAFFVSAILLFDALLRILASMRKFPLDYLPR